MKLRGLQVKDFEATTQAGLATAINDWLQLRKHETLVPDNGFKFETDGTKWWAMILYSPQ